MDPVVTFFLKRALLEDEEEQILQYDLIRRDTLRRKLIEPLSMQYEPREHAISPHLVSELWVNKFCAAEFYYHFRMNTECFNSLVKFVADDGKFEHGYRGGFEPIRLEKKVQIAVWCLAHEEAMLKIGDRFGVTKSTVYTILKEFCKVMESQFIQWPEEEQSCEAISERFKEINGIPGVIGVIDCTHISVKLSKGRQENYPDRILPDSIVLQAVCTAEKLFTHVSTGQHGRNYATKLLANSWLHNVVTAKGADKLFYQNYHLIGDDGYACQDWLLVPFKEHNALSDEQTQFNSKLNQIHFIIKNAFGLLKGRWRRLQNLNMASISNAEKLIMACCCLHNFCINNHVAELEEDIIEDSPGEHHFLTMPEFSGDAQGFAKRQRLMANL